jgi:hypothetical protein
MLTYNMDFSVKIESINVKEKILVVEYFDPHGGDSIRCAIPFKSGSTVDEIKKLISLSVPHETFHQRHEEKIKMENGLIDYKPILDLEGTTFNFKLPKYDNEII